MGAERVVLAAVLLPGSSEDREEPLGELRRLAGTAGADVVGEVAQKLPRANASSFLGKGKIDALKALVEEVDADTVIFDNDLTPAQIRNLERLVDRKVLDRSELILDIFASHARTKQARLQVELAQLEYTLPRLQRMWTHLEKTEGGIGVRGPGERQLETDRRLVRQRVGKLKKQIDEITRRKERQVKAREDEFNVSLVGYTNAGKSTLMNVLTGAHTLVEDKLFATLDTCTRAWNIEPHRRVLLSDTVGFIRQLPHHLIASFHATLEEATHADLLLHVVDAGHPDCERQIEAAEQVLEEIGAKDKPTLMVFNKIDTVRDSAHFPLLRMKYPDSAEVSAKTGKGLETLADSVRRQLSQRDVELTIKTHCGNGKLLAFLAEKAIINTREYTGDTLVLHATIPQQHLGQLRRLADDETRIETR